MRKLSFQLAFLLACALSACYSTPSSTARFDPATGPYWTDPAWVANLLYAVQSRVRYPSDASGRSVRSLHGKVLFTYSEGRIEDPEITSSTGDPELDKLMMQQVTSATPPQANGPFAKVAHQFVADMDMPTSFESAVYVAIDLARAYPKQAVLSGMEGLVTVDFDYLDGKAVNITLAKPSTSKELNTASVKTVSDATLPPPPPGETAKTRHMEVVMCYALEGPKGCPTANNVILIYGTVIGRVY